MAVSLYGLRGKIAAAAVLKGITRRVSHLPAGAAVLEKLIDWVEPAQVSSGAHEATGSYRGIAAQLLREALPEDPAHNTEVIYHPVAGLVRGPKAEAVPELAALIQRADRQPSSGNLLAVAAAARKPYVADLRCAANYYGRALEAHPHELRAIEGILSTVARTNQDWERIWEATARLKPRRGILARGSRFWDPIDALFQQEDSREAIRRSLPLLEQYAPNVAGLHQLLTETIAARLQFLGQFRAGSRLRELMAMNRVRELQGIPLESPLWLRHLLGAYAYLGQTEKLISTAQRPLLGTPNEASQDALEKLRADVALFGGDVSLLRAHAADRAKRLELPAEERFRELVAGQRVAVVGPAATEDQVGKLIENCDVVLRTRYVPHLTATDQSRSGVRTDVAYYSGSEIGNHTAQLSEAVAAGDMKMAVTRPLWWPMAESTPDWLRVARFEFGLYFRGAPLGVQRILYDVLQFHPAEVHLFHADFYAGQSAFASGYRAAETGFGPHRAVNDVVVLHDLQFEFVVTQRLVEAGLVRAHGTTAEVLTLSTEQYLQRLEQGPLGAAEPVAPPQSGGNG